MTRRAIPRTLHLLVHADGGGTETNIRQLCERVPAFEFCSLEEMGEHPVRWYRVPLILEKLRRLDPQVVFCYGITTHVLAALAFPLHVPLIGNVRCVSDFAGTKGLIRRVIDWRVSSWISNSRAGLGDLRGSVIYNGIEPPCEEAPFYAGLPAPVFGVLARGDAKKGHRFALHLWDRLGRPGTLVFAGKLPDELKDEALCEGVLCPGHVSAGPLLRSLDLLLVPSHSEGIPTVLLEAMVRGVPCLATPVGGIPELLCHRKNGFMLPRRKWKEFLERIDWSEARQVAARGREEVLRDYTFDRMRRGFIEVARKYA